MKRSCAKCLHIFEENEMEESHNIPCYMFDGKNRKERKNKADKFGRKLLCRKCHDIYEKKVASVMFNSLPSFQKQKTILLIKKFSERYF